MKSRIEQQEFNAFSADTLGIEIFKDDPLMYYTDTSVGDMPWEARAGEAYDPYNNFEQLRQVMDNFYPGCVSGVQEDSNTKDVWRQNVFNRMEPANFLDCEEAWDEVDRVYREFMDGGVRVTYPEGKSEQETFNEQCRHIATTHAQICGTSCMFMSCGYDPYYNGTQLIQIFEIVIKYLPVDTQFLVCGTDGRMNPNTDVTKLMRNFIMRYGTDEIIVKKYEQEFNDMCATIVNGYNVVDCQPIDENFNPFDNIEDLAPILPVVVRRVHEPFTLGEVMYDLPRKEYSMDVHDNMRHYIGRHGQALIDILNRTDDK